MVARCTRCGEELDVYNDENLDLLYDAYREVHEIISLHKIQEIPGKYAIGKRPLSLLLRWGELTFTRYYDGDIPTKQYAEILQRIYDEPAYFLSILENNRQEIKQSSYTKSKLKAQKLLSMQTADDSRINLVVKYILSECRDITNLALQKCLYYMQGFYRAFYGAFLFEDDCEAWVHGPVYKEIYQRFSGYGFNFIESELSIESTHFSTEEKALIDSVMRHLGCYSGRILEKFTHSETPWLKARGNLSPDEPSVRIIDKELIRDYFDAVKEKYTMLTPADIKSYAMSMFDRV